MEFRHSGESLLKVKADVLVLGIFKGEKFSGSSKSVNDALGDVLKDLSRDEKFEGDMGKSVVLQSTFGKIGAKRVLLIGLGEKSRFSQDTVRKIGILAAAKYKSACANIAFAPEFDGGKAYIAALAEGVMLGAYEFIKYKTKNGAESEIDRVIIVSKEEKERRFEGEIATANALADSITLARDMVNEPPLYMTPSKIADTASAVAQEGGMKCEIFDLEEIKRRGMGGLAAVTSGSTEPPRFIHLTYEPRGKYKTTLAVVGKGITFDSGGLCIKPADSMRTMKMDMAGAAAVLGIMKAVARLKPSVKVHGLISSCENMTGPAAYKPDDVIRAYNGKTIEVINTDAEGRIVLSDALSYAVHLKVDEIVDLATLTGACMVALGAYTAGLMGNDQKLIDRILSAAGSAGEKVWQLPMDDELRPEIRSDVADMKNAAGNRWGGAITAAMFLENFVGDTAWAHIDIAGPAYNEKESGWNPKGGTGFGVRTLVSYIMDR
ncbi:MAG TPA: leucyl aminopeptidase [Thermodesulfobacteriota bacterium]|nr:leucyl aminopeptidase [Thermodesulfobacteriota bacterium]